MNITIEPVKSNEVQLLSTISSKCFYDTFYKYNTEEDMNYFLDKNLTVSSLEKEILETGNYFFFAKMEDEVVGHLKLSASETRAEFTDVKSLEISRIYAVKDKIGFGIGKAMIEFSVSFAKQMNKQIIWLGVWEHNLRAINFYNSFGFTKFSEHIFMVGKDAQTDWLMKKKLL